jgi:hypothetical protein
MISPVLAMLTVNAALVFAGSSFAQPVPLPTSTAISASEAQAQATVAPQTVAAPPVASQPRPPETLLCPGGFPTDLTVLDCRYTRQQRLQQFVTTSVTDQAMLTSIFGSLFTQGLGTPNEWPRTWKYYGYRLGASYTSSVGRGTAEYIVGRIAHDDPRHIKCSDDASPLFRRNRLANGDFSCTNGQRFGHFLLDTVTVRASTKGVAPQDADDPEKLKAITRRYPAWARLAGVFAGALAQYPWEPHAENTFGAISQRAGISFGQTFLGSFFTEYGSSILRPKKLKEGMF